MIVITGSGRSGTSMLMQALIAAGIPHDGEAFPGHTAELQAANPRGFYESRATFLGVDPTKLASLQGTAVKLFWPAIRVTPFGALERVLCSMRDVREFVLSQTRMAKMGRARPQPPNPALQWWTSAYSLIIDAWRRGYALKMVAYESVLADPAAVMADVIGWLGAGDAAAAAASVDPSLRTQTGADLSGVDLGGVQADDLATFDALYAAVCTGQPFTNDLVLELVATNARIAARRREQGSAS